jgi:uncharacterized protein YutE (UPF0331/DUF86 family)
MEILAGHGLLSPKLLSSAISMAGFRNIAVHDYAALDPAIIRAIVDKHLPDLDAFLATLIARLG